MRPVDVLGIVGPTASGKSAVGVAVARAIRGEIVSADSMQVYRHMDIGTAKTPPARREVPHHCLDLADPGSTYSAAMYQADSRAAIDAIRARGVLPVVVGGTGLYVRAALDEMAFPAGELRTDVREELERRAAEEGPQALHSELSRLDARSAALIHPNNVRRVVRALEMLHEGTSYADQASGFAHRRFHYPNTLLVGLSLERAVLYGRIDERVDAMLEDGLLDEVAQLVKAGFEDALTASQAIGYKELIPVLRGERALETAAAEIKRTTRRYAKRQLTWFRADPRIVWLDVTELSPTETAARVLDLLESTEQRS